MIIKQQQKNHCDTCKNIKKRHCLHTKQKTVPYYITADPDGITSRDKLRILFCNKSHCISCDYKLLVGGNDKDINGRIFL